MCTIEPYKRIFSVGDVQYRHEDAGINYYLPSQHGVVATLVITEQGYDNIQKLMCTIESLHKNQITTHSSPMLTIPPCIAGVDLTYTDITKDTTGYRDDDDVCVIPDRWVTRFVFDENGIYDIIILHDGFDEILFSIPFPEMEAIKYHFKKN